MSEINRTNATFRGLVVHNKDNNILKMDQSGNFLLATKHIENKSYNKLINISENESIYTAKKKNLTLSSEEGQVIIRNGKESQTPKYTFLNPSYDVEDDSFFDTVNTNEISKPFSSSIEVNNLRNDAFLIESLGTKSMCLYSNNGLHQVSHGNMNVVGDADILVQASQKLNLTSMGYILLNSERLLASVEEDIHMLSSTGEFKVGGNGLSTIGIKVNSNTEKNFLSIGRVTEKADRNLHIDINEESYDNTEKNGIVLDSKNINNRNTFPDIQLNNYDKSSTNNNNNILTTLNVGIGSDSNDINNSIFVKKENIDGLTYLIPLNNFKFTSTDINRTITYKDTSLGTDTIKSFSSETKVQLSKIYTEAENTSFDYQQGYINRDNHGHLKTKTNSDLHLGTNKNDILSIKNTGNIGINTNNPVSTLQVENNYGLVSNIRLDKLKNYYNSQSVQMNSGNYIVFYNTFKSSLYNLEASIYNVNNDFISNFTILEGSNSFIEYDVDNLKGADDKLVVIYCYYNNVNYITETQIYNNIGISSNLSYKVTHTYLEENCNPRVKSFDVLASSTTGEMFNGYIINYRDQTSSGDINIYLSYFSNLSISIIGSFNLNTALDTYITANTIDIDSIVSRDFRDMSLEYDSKYKKLILIPSGKARVKLTDDSLTNNYFTLLNVISISYNSTTLKPVLTTNSIFLKVANVVSLSDNTRYEVLGTKLLLLNTSALYILSYYVRDNTTSKITHIYREDYNYLAGTISNTTLIESLTNTISTISYRNINIPTISIINTSDYVIGYLNNTSIKYYQSDTTTTTTLTTYINVNMPNILRIKDSSNNYQSSLLFWNNESTNNTYYYKSVNFKEIIGTSSFVNIKNENTNINIKNNGNINIENIMDINKKNNSTVFDNLLIKSFDSEPSSSTTGMEGELKYFGTNLYIYLTKWKKMTLTDV